jgi:hypothetical protein
LEKGSIVNLAQIRTIRDRDVSRCLTRAELLKRLRASLKHEGYDQIPQLECPAAAKKKKLLE